MQQASTLGSSIVPDVLSLDLSRPGDGFPNGRRPADPAVDLCLALVLLDLEEGTGPAGPHRITDLADLPLGPPANDVELGAEFPFLAAPHSSVRVEWAAESGRSSAWK
jgi:hypothetical protein